MSAHYEDNVFINCPFDDEYKPIFDAVVFAVHDAGFIARCALEIGDAAQNRFEKIVQAISDCDPLMFFPFLFANPAPAPQRIHLNFTSALPLRNFS